MDGLLDYIKMVELSLRSHHTNQNILKGRVPLAGIEPATNGLEVRYSSAELQRFSISNGIRTRVATVKGWSPRPLDHGDIVHLEGLEPSALCI
jgi:hypothetical protein